MQNEQSIFDKAEKLRAAGKPFALATVVRTESLTSAKAGSKAIIEADGVIQGWIGGGCSQSAVVKTALQVIAQNKPCLIRVSADQTQVIDKDVVQFASSCLSGGTLDIFVEPIVPKSCLLILGSSPVAQSLSALAQNLEFNVIVACPDADTGLFDNADQTLAGFSEQTLSEVKPNFIIVASQGRSDFAALQAALKLDCDYIAFVASRRKADSYRTKLKNKGLAAERVDRILAPAGLPIGASGPAEVALSILAGIIAMKRGVDASEWSSSEQSPGSKVAPQSPIAEAESGCCGKSNEA